MFSQNLPLEENVCRYKDGSLTNGSGSSSYKFSVSEDLSESLLVTDDSCKSMVELDTSVTDTCKEQSDILSTESLVDAFGTINIVGSSGQNCPTITCSSPRRSTRISKFNGNNEDSETVRKGRKKAKQKGLLDVNILKITRRKRSCSRKQARSSVWGLLGSISQNIEHKVEADVDKRRHRKPKKGRSGQGGEKLEKHKRDRKLKKPEENKCVSSGRICLKVKLGKAGQSCLMDIVPVDSDLHKYCGSKEEFPKSTEDIKRKSLEGGVPINMGNSSDVYVSGVHKGDKGNIIGNSTDNVMVNHKGVLLLGVDGRLETTVDNTCLDPGTSPDSEVINVVPDVQVSEKASEDMHECLISLQSCGSGDTMGLKFQSINIKKGKNKDKLHQPNNCHVQRNFVVVDCKEVQDGLCCGGTLVSTTNGNMPTNISSGKTCSSEPFSSSEVADFHILSETLNVESTTEVNRCPELGTGHESPESQICGGSFLFTNDRKLPKNLMSRVGSKKQTENNDSKGRSRSSSKLRGSRQKPVNKLKIKEKADADHPDRIAEPCQEKEVHKLDNPEESKTEKKNSGGEICSFNISSNGAKEHHIPPRNDAWVRCDDCFKWRRIPAALVDFIRETNCRWVCEDNIDNEFAGCSIPQEMSNEEINQELGISDASFEEDGCGGTPWGSKGLGGKQWKVVQPSSWMHIRSNLFLHRSRKTQTIDEVMVCHCKPPPDGRLGCGDGCLNRMLNIECARGTCPCGEQCSNQKFQKRKYSKLRWFKCGKKGYGLQLLEDIKKGKFLIEYVGEVLDLHSYEARQKEYALKGHKHFYFMTLNGSEVIDACVKGNLGRFINHSCDPNCRTEKWMVNGEVCIGLFALRDIKQGEEVTFDYNYVRVFGAAAKKCVCGSSQCRGYIGGDLNNAEVIVQGDSDDEYPEPVMICEDGQVDDYLNGTVCGASSLDGTEVHSSEILANMDEMNKPFNMNGHLEATTENGNCINRSVPADYKLRFPVQAEGSLEKLKPSVQMLETVSEPKITGKTARADEQDFSGAEERAKDSFQFSKKSDNSQMMVHVKSFSHISETKKKSKSNTNTNEDKNALLTALPPSKTSRPLSSVKKVKQKGCSVHVNKNPEMDSKSSGLPFKARKIPEGSFNNRFEAVEEKLNELLDTDGGVSKRKDASKGYLKLLLLTVASGENSNGEAIQSNRDLSMILDALLKTKSRTVLVDIINKNGLQMLHNIIKQYRKEYNKIPILRKLLKVLEYLAVRQILTHELINGGPPRPGVVSFRDSILTLTEHIDKQVHQIARNFRDKWIPRHMRKNNCIDRDDGGMEFHKTTNCNMFPVGRPAEVADSLKQYTATVVDASVQDSTSVSSLPRVAGEAVARKRKSRWDQPAEEKSNPQAPLPKEPRIQSNPLEVSYSSPLTGEGMLKHGNMMRRQDTNCCSYKPSVCQQNRINMAEDGAQNIENDTPPGFSSPCNSCLIPPSAAPNTIDLYPNWQCEVVLGHQQDRFVSGMSVSYGIPIHVVQQFGIPQAGRAQSWVVAPGTPFHPFPPLPPYPRDKKTPLCGSSPRPTSQPVEQAERDWCNTSTCSEQSTSTYGVATDDNNTSCINNENRFQACGSYTLGRKYFRQQKWNNSKLVPPWIRKRNDLEFGGNNAKNGMCSIGDGSGGTKLRGPFNPAEVSVGFPDSSTCNKHSQHHNEHY